jgi:hypothetical protein
LIKILQQSGEKSPDEVLKLIIQECEAYSVDDDVTLVMLKKI